MATNQYERHCGFCGNISTPLFVHGHGECPICHNNIDECCSGERSQKNEQDSELPNVQDKKPDRP